MPLLESDLSLRVARRRGEMARRKIADLSRRLESRGKSAAHVDELAAALDEVLQQAAQMTAPRRFAGSVQRARWRRKALAAALMLTALAGIGFAMTSYADSVRLKFVPRVAVASSCTG